MTFDAIKLFFFRLIDKFLFQFFGRKTEGDVHKGAAVLSGVPTVKAFRVIDCIVKQSGLFRVALRHRRESALRLDPGDGLTDHVDAESGRRVVERVFVEMDGVAKHRGDIFRAFREKLPAGDDDSDPGGAEIFLRAGVDEGKFFEVKGA